MRIARLLIYEGSEEALRRHFTRSTTFLRPGETRIGDFADAVKLLDGVSVHEDGLRELGGRVELGDGEIAAIKVVK